MACLTLTPLLSLSRAEQAYVAARAFYNTLSLATAKLLRVEQEAAYGDIRITILSA